MKTSRFEVLSQTEVEQIHACSMEILATVGVKVDFPFARQIFREHGAIVDDQAQTVRLPEDILMKAVQQAPRQFSLYGADGMFKMTVGGENTQFAGLGTPTRMIDLETGENRPSTFADVVQHIQLIDSCQHIHNSQMDVWPNDIPMTVIHTESINAWAHNSRKPFGLGCYGFVPTLDMMRMVALICGGKEEIRQRPRFLAICSVVSPLQMAQIQLEGLLICAAYGQPLAMSPEAIAGATAPATLAGLLAQENAAVLAHIALAQMFRPGAPVLYGTVSTIANMRNGMVALGAPETGLITAAAAQMARFYGLPSRSVGGATEAKTEDLQAGMEHASTLLPAVLAGINLITCGGTLDSTMLESHAMLVFDDELCGAVLRTARGIEVNANTLAMEQIHKIGFSGNYLAEQHTVQNFRKEHFIPRLLPREPYESWVNNGKKSTLELSRERARALLAAHRPVEIDPALEVELQAYRDMAANRKLDELYAGELPQYQNWNEI